MLDFCHAPSERGRITQAPRLMAPFHSFEGAIGVVDAGADEVYCGVTVPGLQDFVLYRGRPCEIATYKELGESIEYAHRHRAKVFLTANLPFIVDKMEKMVRNHIRCCLDEGVDGLIIANPGILSMVKDMGVDVELIASTFTSSLNYEAVNFLGRLGFDRVVLDRHLTIDEISEIVQHSEVEIEVFIHGGGCSNINGNCYLLHTEYFFACALEELKAELRLRGKGTIGTPCQLPFDIYDVNDGQKIGANVPALDAFTFCSLCQLAKLFDIGISGFKIVGRCLPSEYVESTTRVYRRFIDLLRHGQMAAFTEKLELFRSEVPSERILNFQKKLDQQFNHQQEKYCNEKRCYYLQLAHTPKA